MAPGMLSGERWENYSFMLHFLDAQQVERGQGQRSRDTVCSCRESWKTKTNGTIINFTRNKEKENRLMRDNTFRVQEFQEREDS